MRYIEDNTLDYFKAWSGGKEWLDTFKQHPDAFEYISNFIEEWSELRYQENNPLSSIEINDFLWFDAFDILVEEGYVDGDMNWKDDE